MIKFCKHVYLLLFSSLMVFFPSASHAQNPLADEAALEVLAQINAYRVGVGVHPLTVNPILVEMAKFQAEFVASQNFEPANWDFHLDSNGEYPRQRAIKFKWRPYADIPAQVQVGENAGLGDINYVMNFWSTSTLHKTAMSNPIYREVGIWTIPNQLGHLYIIVFGARADIFPTPLDPNTCELIVPNEANSQGTGTWMKNIESLHFFSEGTSELTARLGWAKRIAIPTTAPSQFIIEFIEGNRRIRQDYVPLENIVVLPETLGILRGETTTPCLSALQNAPSDNLPVVSEALPAPQGASIPPSAATEIVVNTTLPPSAQTEIVYTTTAGTQALPTSSGIIGTVNVSLGANLHCRQYPDSNAQSLALIPANTQLTLLGLPTQRDESGEIGFRDAPRLSVLDLKSLSDPATADAYPLEQLWVWAEWQAVGCWVNAKYLNVSYDNKLFLSPSAYLLAGQDGILEFIPYNVAGGEGIE